MNIAERKPLDWAEERALRVVDDMLEYARLRAAAGASSKEPYGLAHTFIAQALREAEARGRMRGEDAGETAASMAPAAER